MSRRNKLYCVKQNQRFLSSWRGTSLRDKLYCVGKERRLKAYAFVKINFSKCSKRAKLNGSHSLVIVEKLIIALEQRLALL